MEENQEDLLVGMQAGSIKLGIMPGKVGIRIEYEVLLSVTEIEKIKEALIETIQGNPDFDDSRKYTALDLVLAGYIGNRDYVLKRVIDGLEDAKIQALDALFKKEG